MSMNPKWTDVDEFYDDTRRSDSPEIDLGHRWFMESHQPPFRLTYLSATGELVLLREEGDDPYVELVGWFPKIEDVRKAIATCDPGYGQPKSAYQVRIVCRKKAIAGEHVTEDHRRESFARHRGAQDQGGGQQGLF